MILLLELFSDSCQGGQRAAHLVFQAGTQWNSASRPQKLPGAAGRTASLAAALEPPPKLQHQHSEPPQTFGRQQQDRWSPPATGAPVDKRQPGMGRTSQEGEKSSTQALGDSR